MKKYPIAPQLLAACTILALSSESLASEIVDQQVGEMAGAVVAVERVETPSEVDSNVAERVRRTLEGLEMDHEQASVAGPLLRDYFVSYDSLEILRKPGAAVAERARAGRALENLDRKLRHDLSATLNELQVRALDRVLLLFPDRDLDFAQRSTVHDARSHQSDSPLIREDAAILEASAKETRRMLDELALDEKQKAQLEPALFNYQVASFPIASRRMSGDLDVRERIKAIFVLSRYKTALRNAIPISLSVEQALKLGDMVQIRLDTDVDPSEGRGLRKLRSPVERVVVLRQEAARILAESADSGEEVEGLAAQQASALLEALDLPEAKRIEVEVVVRDYFIVRHPLAELYGKGSDRQERAAARNGIRDLDRTFAQALATTLDKQEQLLLDLLTHYSYQSLSRNYPLAQMETGVSDRKEKGIQKQVAKQLAQAIETIKLSPEQVSELERVIRRYYVMRAPLVDQYEFADRSSREKSEARWYIDTLGIAFRSTLHRSLDEAQRLALRTLLKSDFEKIRPFDDYDLNDSYLSSSEDWR